MQNSTYIVGCVNVEFLLSKGGVTRLEAERHLINFVN